MTELHRQVEAILAQRRQQLPAVEQSLQTVRQVGRDLEHLEQALQELSEYPGATHELRSVLADFDPLRLQRELVNCEQAFSVCQARLRRETLNIGVSGQARMGKSTLLQTIAGLSDEQVPTGEGIPVTAVRSRLRHSSSHERALLTLHTFESFRDRILDNYHRVLGLPSTPSTPSEFQRLRYDLTDLSPEAPHSHGILLQRLREMQAAFPSYGAYLNGGTREISLSELRPWVAYPTQEEEEAGDCPRLYLAVQDVLIECPFPEAQVEQLMVVDLPGLGELDAKAEEHHIDGLRHEVDLVLLIKRPVEGNAFWRQEDANAIDLLDEARKPIRQRRDFVFVVVNDGGVKPSLRTALLGDIKRRLNEGQDQLHFRVLTCDALEHPSVQQSLLNPVLEHLASRLPSMDSDVLQEAEARWQQTQSRLYRSLEELGQSLRRHAPEAVGTTEKLTEYTEELNKDLAIHLQSIIERFYRIARSGDEDLSLVQEIRTARNAIEDWVQDGFGQGYDEWLNNAVRTMQRDRNSGGFASEEFNRIRVQLGETYCRIDRYLEKGVEQLWTDIAEAIGSCTGVLLSQGDNGRERLQWLASLLRDANEPCEQLEAAVRDLLEVRIRYRSHFHPRVREVIDPLNLEVFDDESGRQVTQITVSIDSSGAKELYQRISDLTIQTAYEVEKALLREISFPALVYHAAAEQFEDSFVRSGHSRRELARLARSYRDEIWPNVFDGMDAQNAKVAKVRRSLQNVLQQLQPRGTE